MRNTKLVTTGVCSSCRPLTDAPVSSDGMLRLLCHHVGVPGDPAALYQPRAEQHEVEIAAPLAQSGEQFGAAGIYLAGIPAEDCPECALCARVAQWERREPPQTTEQDHLRAPTANTVE